MHYGKPRAGRAPAATNRFRLIRHELQRRPCVPEFNAKSQVPAIDDPEFDPGSYQRASLLKPPGPSNRAEVLQTVAREWKTYVDPATKEKRKLVGFGRGERNWRQTHQGPQGPNPVRLFLCWHVEMREITTAANNFFWFYMSGLGLFYQKSVFFWFYMSGLGLFYQKSVPALARRG